MPIKIILFILSLFLSASPPVEAKSTPQSVFDKVQQNKVMRCGYFNWEPYFVKDPNTGEMSGITYDYINAIAMRNGLKVDWASDVAPDQIIPSIKSGKIDLFCVPCSTVAEWEEQIDFIGSFGNLPYYVYVGQKKPLNESELSKARFAVIDGFIPMVETPKAFPDAKIATLPQMTSMGELYDQIRYGKADAIVNEHLTAQLYMKNNEGIIKRLNDTPVALKPMSFPAIQDDPQWKNFIDTAFDPSIPENAALLHDLMEKYGLTKDMLLFD